MDSYAQTIIPFRRDANTQKQLEPSIIYSEQNNITSFSFDTENASLYPESVNNTTYNHLTIKGVGIITQIGEAELPAYSMFVPVNAENVDIIIKNSEYIELTSIDVWPSQPSTAISSSAPVPFIKDSIYYSTDSFLPNNIVEIEEFEYFESICYARIKISPIQYNPSKRTIRCYSKIEFSVSNTMIHSLMESSKTIGQLSYNQDNYLIVCNDSTSSVMTDFIEWKRFQGYNVHLIHKASWNSFNEVRDSVRTYYNSLPNCKYLLIVGGYNMVPAEIAYDLNIKFDDNHQMYTDTLFFATDYRYSCINASQYSLPQLAVGRIPSTNLTDLSIILNKTIEYQQTPSYTGTALNCGYYQDSKPKDSHEDYLTIWANELTRNHLLNQGFNVTRIYKTDTDVTPIFYNLEYCPDSIPYELRDPAFNWQSNSSHIINGFNSNPNLVLFIGHGAYYYWANILTGFNQIASFNNTTYPIVLSMACNTGQYVMVDGWSDLFEHNCFAHELLRHHNGGAMAVIAPTEEIPTILTEWWTLFWYDALFPNANMDIMLPFGLLPHFYDTRPYSIGDAMIGAFKRSRNNNNYAIFPYSFLMRFHCFGDPSTELYTGTPEDLSVVDVKQVNDSIIINTNTIQNCKVMLIPKDESQSDLFMMADSITGRFVFPNIRVPYNISVQKHNCALKYIESYDIYLQNMEFNNGVYHYEGRNVFIGKNVTNEAPQGSVVVKPNAQLTVKGLQSVLTTDGFEVKVGGTFNIE